MPETFKTFSIDQIIQGINNGDRIALSKGITLIESEREEDLINSKKLIQELLPKSGKAIRLGITGVPGVGKSTFIEALGLRMAEKGQEIAVLSIDPTSARNKGSILGDKTRMNQLSSHPKAFIRPSPSGLHLGGMAGKTRETMLLCEAAGFDVIIVETVGVGQSEIAISDMTDFVILLMLAGGGDDLQGIKRGIMEIADMVVINKVDGDNVKSGKLARKVFEQALHLFPANENGWVVPVSTASSLEGTGISSIEETLQAYRAQMSQNGYFEKNRINQRLQWFSESLRNGLMRKFESQHQDQLRQLEERIKKGSIDVNAALELVLNQTP